MMEFCLERRIRAVFSFLTFFICLAAGNVEFDGYRLIQQEVKGEFIGSWRWRLNGVLDSFDKSISISSRNVAIMKFMDLQDPSIIPKMYLYAGIMILIPNNRYLNRDIYARCGKNNNEDKNNDENNDKKIDGIYKNYCTETEMNQAREIEKILFIENRLMNERFNSPIYFVYESIDTLQLYEDVQNIQLNTYNPLLSRNTIFTDFFKEPLRIKFIKGTNIHGWITDHHQSINSSVLPTIAIITYYDTFGPAPSLSYGAGSNGTGLVTALELSRIFSKISIALNSPKFNLLFVYTSASLGRFEGLEEWISKIDQRILRSIEFSICLDTLTGALLHLHLSKLPKSPTGLNLIESLKISAKHHGSKFDVNVSKIRVNESELPWQHERLALHWIPGGTLSSLPHAAGGTMQRGSIMDQELPKGIVAHMEKNIRVIGLALAHLIYTLPSQQLELLDDLVAPNKYAISAWLRTLQAIPRAPMVVTDQDPVGGQIHQTCKENLKHVEVNNFKIPLKEIVFYMDEVVNIKVLPTKGLMFDLLHMSVNAVLLTLLYVRIQGISMNDIYRKVWNRKKE